MRAQARELEAHPRGYQPPRSSAIMTSVRTEPADPETPDSAVILRGSCGPLERS